MNSSGIVTFKYGTNLRHFWRNLLHSLLKIEAVGSSEVLVYLYQPRGHHVTEECIFHSHCIENLILQKSK